jgi:alginate O-acetyltransferase complex protein AlgI
MLFTTATFALLFLPLVLAVYYGLGRFQAGAAVGWLFIASLFFYGWWMPEFTLLLLASITVNFFVGGRLASTVAAGQAREAKRWLWAGVAFNLGLLGYFKYANFFIGNLNAVLGGQWSAGEIVLPIGISFYSFTQIAFIVDAYQGKVRETRPVHYGLFVTYFPHLIAGPVLHHAQMMPQFADPQVMRWRPALVVTGLAVFALGLLKKVVLADGIAPYADAAFQGADAGVLPTAEEAWLGALAYTFQLYFDFSGYSDMAIGLSLMFNIRLPFNFDSPYRARSISEFWRRWHMTLSAFLRDYLYVPLGGNRHGPLRRYLNLAATMLLGGLWHGASWSFVIWGGLHGAYLMLNHGWRAFAERRAWQSHLDGSRAFALLAWALTFAAAALAWVFFRAQSLDGAGRMLQAMAGQGASQAQLLWNAGLHAHVGWLLCAPLAAMAFLAPNSNRIGQWLETQVSASSAWRDAVALLALATVLGMVLLNTARDAVSAFIYFNF